ncbi:5-dehydro-4-deoxy-D-glucuronate isomerase [Sphingobacterium lactis]|uniref:5-dehydro-4-deoxy-D-glucuronate isomerase n=1 Tax=Sphingobacterium lactis TaxID=797291 RepID=UPI003EC845C9
MKPTFETRFAIGPNESKQMDTENLRKTFLIDGLFKDDAIHFVYTHYDRYMAGSAKPVNESLELETIDELLKEPYFLSRRELGIINIGGQGTVQVDGESYALDFKEALYVGKGAKKVIFSSADPKSPAKFYLNSTPAHHSYPTKKIAKADANKLELGAVETSNVRTINQMLLHTTVETCQLQMGLTELAVGSVWNTMPAHTHDRRMEVYLYFELPEGQAVSHFMGPREETRHIWMHNEQAVISPPWSIHSGAGTSNYSFIWGMAGENMDYNDMDSFKVTDIR